MGSVAAFVLVWVRTSTLVLVARPVFGQPGVPALARLGLSAVLAWLLLPLVPIAPEAILQGLAAPTGAAAGSGLGPAWAGWAYALAREAVVGAVMAFGINTVFAAIMLAGQLVDLPMGFSVVNVIDPTMGQEVPLIGQFQMLLATLVFFGVNGHHEMIRALAQSLRLVPPGAMAASGELLDATLDTFAQAFLLGIRLGAPVMAALFLSDVALAVVARAVPQLNVFVVGFPVKIVLGFVAILLALPAFTGVLSGIFGKGGGMWEWVSRMVSGLAP
ncbi:MAG: flagellar biosynthetic protein FliR [Limnochordaceae bacterium]|nr:flagellar biosynthetic protein FliR [Limnochordaceae bacterium]